MIKTPNNIPNSEYPRLKLSDNKQIVFLFLNDETYVVVKGADTFHYVGQMSDFGYAPALEDYEGEVIICNA